MTHPERLKAIRRVLAPGGRKTPTEVLEAVRVALYGDGNDGWGAADDGGSNPPPPPIPPDGPPDAGG